jgi:hypothetical protein
MARFDTKAWASSRNLSASFGLSFASHRRVDQIFHAIGIGRQRRQLRLISLSFPGEPSWLA